MRQAYLDYSMSVIVARALPDVRDGLKPVQRRILYTMYESGLRNDRPFRKSATTVGDVMGKYHPHGDAPIYDALVRLAQDFAARYALVMGHGNVGCYNVDPSGRADVYDLTFDLTQNLALAAGVFVHNSIDDDPPAHMRYTEARLAAISNEMLADIDKETVDFYPNYDNRHQQPTVLPARVPNLIVNGSAGIAVGMATNIPPHNLREIVAATKRLIDDPDLTTDDLCETVVGPDFPGGSVVYRFDDQRNVETGAAERVDAIRRAYAQGRGRIVARAKAHNEQLRGNRDAIIVTELPY